MEALNDDLDIAISKNAATIASLNQKTFSDPDNSKFELSSICT